MAAPHFFSGVSDELAAEGGKAALRASLRAVAVPADRRVAGRMAERLTRVLRAAGAGPVASFWPLGDEPDLRDWMSAAHLADRVVLLPRIVQAEAPLAFDAWHPGAGTRADRLGTRVANADRRGRDLSPAAILVPGLGFDRAGGRIGRGGGFYDRTLAAHPAALAIGVAFSARVGAAVPMEAHDRRMGWIVTERETIECCAPGAGARMAGEKDRTIS